MKLTKIVSLTYVLIAISTANAQLVIFNDDAPTGGLLTGVDSTTLGSTSGPNSAEFDESTIGGQFNTLLNTTNLDVTSYVGEDFTATVQYYIPTSTNAAGNDLIYLQYNLIDATPLDDNTGSAGFINLSSATKDTWLTLTLNGTTSSATVPSPTALRVALIYAENGFGGTRDFSAVSTPTILLDDFTVTLTNVPEPSAFALIVGAMAGFAFLRRRK